MKRTKKFNQEWAEAIALLPQNLQQSLTTAIRSYQNEGMEPEGLHPIAQALFIVIRPTIDARARRCAYQKERRNRSCLSRKKMSEPVVLNRVEASSIINLSSDLHSKEEGVSDKPVPLYSNPAGRFMKQMEKARKIYEARHKTKEKPGKCHKAFPGV